MISKLSDNITVISHQQSSNIYYLDFAKKILIDTGHYLDRDEILSDFANAGINIGAIDYLLVTHAHVDHVGNCAYMQQHNPNMHIVVSDSHDYFLNHLNEFNAVEGIDSIAEPYQTDMVVSDGARICITDTDYIECIMTPGHTTDGISFWLPTQQLLFSGDTIYSGIVPQLDIYQPLPLALRLLTESYQRLQALPIRMICPGHGSPIENVGDNWTMLSRKLRKFAQSPDLTIINNFIPTVEHYINDHPGVTKQNIIDYFAVKYRELLDKGFADFDQPVSDYPVIMNKVLMMMDYLQMVRYDDDSTAHLVREVNHYIKQ